MRNAMTEEIPRVLYTWGISVCRKTSTGSKGFALWRVEIKQYPTNIATPLGEGLGLLPTGLGDVTK